MSRPWILFAASITMLLFGGGIAVAPARISEWVHDVAIEEVATGLKPIAVGLEKMQKTLDFIQQLVKESRDREIRRGSP